MDGLISGTPMKEIALQILRYLPIIGNPDVYECENNFKEKITHFNLLHLLLEAKLGRPTDPIVLELCFICTLEC